MKKLKNSLGLKVFAIIVLAFISLTWVFNVNICFDVLAKAKQSSMDFGTFISEFKTSYTSDIKLKNSYINLNGLFAKITGRKVYNNVVMLENGLLINDTVSKPDNKNNSDNMAEFSKYLSQKGIEFLYVQAPYKLDIKNELLPVGVDNKANFYADEFTDMLKEKDVDILDLREHMTAEKELVEKYYYVTDHHWNNDGAFLGFQKIVEKIDELFSDVSIKSEFTDKASWNVEVFEDLFLGTLGKRVGTYYAGVDDFQLYTPKLKTEMSLYNNKHMQYYCGDFEKAIIRKNNLEKDFFGRSTYCSYIGGDYPIIQHFNKSAASDLKILFIKDSYTLPVQSFLATVFKKVDVLDPRYLTSYTVAEYIECNKPDIVICMINPSVMVDSRYYNYGVDDCEKFECKTETVVKAKDIIDINNIDENNGYYYIRFATELSSKTKYEFSFSDIDFIKSDNKKVTVALYNASDKEFFDSQLFDLEYLNENKYEWSFITPEVGYDDLQLIIYSGEFSKAGGNHITLFDAELIKYE